MSTAASTVCIPLGADRKLSASSESYFSIFWKKMALLQCAWFLPIQEGLPVARTTFLEERTVFLAGIRIFSTTTVTHFCGISWFSGIERFSAFLTRSEIWTSDWSVLHRSRVQLLGEYSFLFNMVDRVEGFLKSLSTTRLHLHFRKVVRSGWNNSNLIFSSGSYDRTTRKRFRSFLMK